MKTTITRNWIRSFLAYPIPALLTREQFVAQYMPQYAKDYSPPSGIRMVVGASGVPHVQMSSRGSIQAQVTKRDNRIDENYAAYCSDHAAQTRLTPSATDSCRLPSNPLSPQPVGRTKTTKLS